MTVFRTDQLGFGRPGGQKSNKSRASDVHGPSSVTGGDSGTALRALRSSVGRVWRAGRAVNAVGSESDLRRGASSERLAGIFRGVGTCAISSRMNWVESDGMNSVLVDSTSWFGAVGIL